MGKTVAIIGAGPAGVVAAIALKRQGFEPTLYDKVDPIEVLKETLRTGEQGVIQFGETGGTVSLYGNGLRALKNLGLLDKVEELRRVQNDSMVFALQDGSDRVVRNLHTTKPGEIEPMYVLRSEFHALLMRESNFLGVKTFAGKKFASLEETADSQVIVTFTDGTIVEVDFVIGADGVYSGVRRFIFPEAPLPTIYGCGYVGIVDLGPHPSGINVKFDDMMAIHMDPIGGHAMYNSTYSPTGGAFNIIDWNKPEGVTSDDADWKPYLDLPKETSKLAEVLEGWGMKQNLVDVVRTAKRLAPLSLVDLPDLPVFYKGRVVLIGDAAHGTLPTMGQGLNLALEDAAR
ncbi:FAD/NAD(P)-binding domain-containing protein [Rhizoclosmatium globosum]|uniref:FAD/NAD(P)-binding domain-containing protein n=1 Tax=Rhizoclosmatium globosum TaxID=329046 RepID=A0A1Y2CDJ3_9FUNG|nr:FAD/NAD(P)-binding domain-containing protein [Rhizoclosmatium globosum]|eukprot:ORY45119.1 FAD/NAD(P)-binding domain-containing protein [Rhizoclosmatium globosum]